MSEDYEIGYGKPPEHTQFKTGQSGNSKGRPKGSKNLKADLTEELAEMIVVTEGGRRRPISKQRAMIKSLFAKGAKGDVRAIHTIFSMVERLLNPDISENEERPLGKDDQEILDRFLSERQGKKNTEEKS